MEWRRSVLERTAREGDSPVCGAAPKRALFQESGCFELQP
jgi:hypothetical protein